MSDPNREAGALDRAEWLATILAHSADLIAILDLDGAVLYLNRVIGGRSESEILGHRAVDMLGESSKRPWEEAFACAVREGETREIEVVSDGGFSWRARIVPVSREGHVAYVMCFGTDVSFEKETQRSLRAREHQLRLALEASGMGQWWWNVASDEVTWDAAAKRIFAFEQDRNDITYATFLGRIHPDDVERVKRHVATALETGVYDELEARVVLPNGSERWALMIGRVLHDASGAPTDLLGGIVDITQSKVAEAQLRRTQKLEAIGQLAGGVAHDFNNLLVAIMGNIELARRVDGEDQREAHLDEALIGCSRAADLTRQLLAFGRRQQLHETELDLNEVIADTMKLLRRLLPENIAVEITSSPSPARVYGDRGQIEQVLVNLCVNARDAMPDGGRLVISVDERELDEGELNHHPWARAGRHVVVSVRDSGSGIAPEVIERVFEPFFTTKPQGTGLGLASAYGIIKQHGGVLHVESELGEGTTFELSLPRAITRRPAPAPEARAAVRGGTETILVAEDEPAVSRVVARVLEGAGYRVLTAHDGARAVELFREEQGSIALVLVDMVMPRKSGAEVAAEVRRLEPNVGIVLSSGYSSALANGPATAEFDEILPKPYEPDQLLRVIREVLDSRGGRSEHSIGRSGH